MTVDWRVVVRAAFTGLSIIVPVVIITEVLDAQIDDFADSRWLFFPFALILFAYAAAGYAGGKLGRLAPYTHGILAALTALGTWLAIRGAERLVRGKEFGFGPRDILTNAMFAAGFGLFGAAVASRAPQAQTADQEPSPDEPA